MILDTTTVVWGVAVLAALLLAGAVAVLVRLVRTRRELRRAGLPTGPRWVFWGAVLYLVLPADLLPDPVYLDDIGVLLLALRTMRGSLRAGAPEVSDSGRADNPPTITLREETNHPFDSYKSLEANASRRTKRRRTEGRCLIGAAPTRERRCNRSRSTTPVRRWSWPLPLRMRMTPDCS